MRKDNQPPAQLKQSELTGSARFRVRVTPGADRDEVSVEATGLWRVRLRARPIEGKANVALIALLAERLGIPRRNVSILHGQASREKLVEVQGVSPEEALKRLGGQ